MSKQVLKVEYHPAKKEIRFHRFQGETEIRIARDSVLCKYMNKRGFVLQDQGNAFFSDIAKTFDGERNINLEVITTKNDFEDFMQMVEFYNENDGTEKGIKIDATLLAELPDMEKIYCVVKEHGERSIGILEYHKARFFEVPRDNDVVEKCVDLFAGEVQKEVDSIKEKIQALADNNVNLCFTGVYSSGKSALINAILGYAILPEAMKSETARMFRIQSPKTDEKVRIVFHIRADFTELMWNDSKSTFVFSAGPNENHTRLSIQEVINYNHEKHQYEQIREILKKLNTNNDVSSEIKVFFPVPLDSDELRFTIYDTPGTDSNYGEHQMVLQDALSEQTHSILVFVAAPIKTEGEGNNALLNYLKEAEKKDSKTSIDLGRSLFVMNFADIIKPDQREDFKNAEIEDLEEGDFSIKLSDKKLFFTSAIVAYAAKAKKNNIQTKSDEFTIREKSGTINDEEFGRYYQQNHCAASEIATKNMIEKSTLALEKAEKEGNILDVLHICSGVYALEDEIKCYGEKFAMAVRAFAIIDSVDKALKTMNNNARELEKRNERNINNVNEEIVILKAAISDSINQAYKESEVPENAALPEEILKELHLDSSYLSRNVVGGLKKFIMKALVKLLLHISDKGFINKKFKNETLEKITRKINAAVDNLTDIIAAIDEEKNIIGKVRFDKNHKHELTQKITATVDDFTRNFLEKRQKLLEKKRDAFIERVKKIIDENGNISDDAKGIICNIREPEIKPPANLGEFGEIYDSHRRTGNFLFIKTEYIDKESFIKDVEVKLSDIVKGMANDFEQDYRKSLENILRDVKKEFEYNLGKYSVLIIAKLKDINTMELLRGKIKKAAEELESCQKELEKLIWSEKNNER